VVERIQLAEQGGVITVVLDAEMDVDPQRRRPGR
jgi:hypothetical protein